jgi:D-arabinose 1-dehydrogenase-like Zn-dependent alcohol dehydrogenase
MRAAFIVDTKKIEIREVPTPKYNDDEMLVRVEACGVCTSDMASFLNSYSDEMKKRMPMPRRVGHEPAGTVVEIGKNVKGFKVGDR